MGILGNGLKKVLACKSAIEFLSSTGDCHFLRLVRQRQLLAMPLLKPTRLQIGPSIQAFESGVDVG